MHGSDTQKSPPLVLHWRLFLILFLMAVRIKTCNKFLCFANFLSFAFECDVCVDLIKTIWCRARRKTKNNALFQRCISCLYCWCPINNCHANFVSSSVKSNNVSMTWIYGREETEIVLVTVCWCSTKLIEKEWNKIVLCLCFCNWYDTTARSKKVQTGKYAPDCGMNS